MCMSYENTKQTLEGKLRAAQKEQNRLHQSARKLIQERVQRARTTADAATQTLTEDVAIIVTDDETPKHHLANAGGCPQWDTL